MTFHYLTIMSFCCQLILNFSRFSCTYVVCSSLNIYHHIFYHNYKVTLHLSCYCFGASSAIKAAGAFCGLLTRLSHRVSAFRVTLHLFKGSFSMLYEYIGIRHGVPSIASPGPVFICSFLLALLFHAFINYILFSCLTLFSGVK